ncbi:MAG: hypothetical protein ACO1OB_11000 [Archangium sp.]
MIYGDQKSRVMARSILPSRYRGAARDRAFIHRHARHAANQAVRQLTAESWEDAVDFGEHTWRRISTFVRDRRSADKLNHFHRWAYERTWKFAKPERLDSIRGVLPTGLIGDHALDHLENDRRLTVDITRKRWVKKSRFLDRGELAELFRRFVTLPDAIRHLHRCLKTATRSLHGKTYGCTQLRLLGAHDVLRFLHDVEKHRVTRFVVDGFARVFKATNDPRRAAIAAAICVELPTFDWAGEHVPE